MKTASVQVETVNKSKLLSLTDPRVFLDGSSTARKPDALLPDAVGVSMYTTDPGEIVCTGVLSYQVGSCTFGVMFENPVVVGELCPMLGLYVTQDAGERDTFYAIMKSRDPSTVLQRLALFQSNQGQSITVSLVDVEVSATMTYGTDCHVTVIVKDPTA